MTKAGFVAAVALAFTSSLACGKARQAAPPRPVISAEERAAVRAQLRAMAAEDRDARLNGKSFWDLDVEHTRELKKMLDRYGWIRISEFGADADRDAFLIAQHSDRDLPFQVRVLGELERMVALGETSKKHYAYLYDRVARRRPQRPDGTPTGEPARLQRYGTQGTCVNGTWEPHPVESPATLDRLRAEMGLEPMSEYRKRPRCPGSSARAAQ